MTPWLADHLWQSTLFGVAAGLLAVMLRRNRAGVRHWIWFAASLKFVVPFVWLTIIGRSLAWLWPGEDIPGSGHPVVSLVVSQIARPFSGGLAAGQATSTSLWPGAMAGVWLLGFAVIVLARARDWQRIRSVLHAGHRVILRDVSVPAGVTVRKCAGLHEPGVVGIWRPVLLMPADIERQLTPLQLRAVVEHEVCHVTRHDNLTAAIHMAVEAVCWFHPLVWWIGRRMIDERERACDEHVLSVVDDRRPYAEAILRICELYVGSPLASVSGATGAQVKQRIEAIMMNRIGQGLTVGKRAVLVFAGLLAIGVPVAIGMSTSGLAADAAVSNAVGVSQGRRSGAPPVASDTKGAALKTALFQLRDAINRYDAARKAYPASLDALVTSGYLKQIPVDPMTGSDATWQLIAPRPDALHPAVVGVFDVRSSSNLRAPDGSLYSSW